MSDDIHSTQQLANAAEAFVGALSALFPGGTFSEFFHGDTLRRAYWDALQAALDGYTTINNVALAKGLLSGQVMSDSEVVGELLKLFVPDQLPDYAFVAQRWADALQVDAGDGADLQTEAEMWFSTLAGELRRSRDIRMAVQQLAQKRFTLPDQPPVDIDQDRLLHVAVSDGLVAVSRQVGHLLALAAARDPALIQTMEDGLIALARTANYAGPGDVQALWETIDELEDDVLRLRLLGQIAPRLGELELAPDPLAVVQDAIEAGGPRLDPAVRVEALLDLAPHLKAPTPTRNGFSFQGRVLSGVSAIGDPASRVRALGVLIESLPPMLQTTAVSMAFSTATENISNEFARATALSALPPHLPPQFLDQLLSIAFELDAPDARALLLGRMLPYLQPERQADVLMAALEAIEQISGDDARTQALIALAPHIDAVGPLRYIPEGLQQAIMVTFSIEHADDRARAFAALAPYLSPELLTEALQVVKDIHDDFDRASTLARLAPRLQDELQVAAYGIAREIGPAEARAHALATIAPYLSSSARAQAMAEALVAALAITRRYERVAVLVDLAPHLSDDLRDRALRDAMTATRSIPDESERARALIFLAPHVPAEHLADAVADAYTILDPLERVPALSALIPYLPDEPRLRVARDVVNLAAALKPPHQKASILAVVAPVLPPELIDQAVGVAEQIDTPFDRLHVLTALLPYRPDQLHNAALSAARAVPNRYQRVNALLELVPHTSLALRPPILNEALETALGIEDDYDRASALAHLGPYVDMHNDVQHRQQDVLSLALETCFEVMDPVQRADLLTRLARVWVQILGRSQSYTLWRQAVMFLRQQPYGEVLTDLAALSPVLDHLGASDAVSRATGAVWDVLEAF